jgi:plasmid stabilization system protein ParE
MSYAVRWTDDALVDLDELFEFLLLRDEAAAEKALAAIRKGVAMLELFPFSCRVASRRAGAVLRELIVPFGRRGYVVLFEVEDDETVTILAVRHQREDDYH